MLSPYRVLDLTDEKGLLCGKLLGDLGADVIKIERPGGDPARNIGPFYHDEPDPEKSLFWFAMNSSKRGITLDIETIDGRELFKRLVKSADFVLESFPPGYMDRLGLGYSALEKVNPGIIMVSITPFGQTGPYMDYKAPDIVAWGMGGYMFPWEEADHPPIRVSHHSQAYLHGACEAAMGAMMALFSRQTTGEGQHVDVSIHESIVTAAFLLFVSWDLNKALWNRSTRGRQSARVPQMWPCKDGYVVWFYWGGERADRRTLPLVKWMEDEGMADDFLKQCDWEALDLTTITQETADAIEKPTRKFFMAHTKAELLEGAVKRGIIMYPISTVADIRESSQLASREFWVDVEHSELGTSITYPGSFTYASEIPPRISRRAPLIGEHNQEIYEKELILSKEEVVLLKQAGVI